MVCALRNSKGLLTYVKTECTCQWSERTTCFGYKENKSILGVRILQPARIERFMVHCKLPRKASVAASARFKSQVTVIACGDAAFADLVDPGKWLRLQLARVPVQRSASIPERASQCYNTTRCGTPNKQGLADCSIVHQDPFGSN